MTCSYFGQLVHSLDPLVPVAVQQIVVVAAVSGPAGPAGPVVFAMKLCISDSKLIKT